MLVHRLLKWKMIFSIAHYNQYSFNPKNVYVWNFVSFELFEEGISLGTTEDLGIVYVTIYFHWDFSCFKC
jgi:hypothetical protein